MTLRQAKQLKEGTLVTAIVDDPHGGGSTWSPGEAQWIYEPIRSGQSVIFQEVIPKVRVVRHGEWNDGLEYMLFCKKQDGRSAWLNIGNTKKVRP